MDTSVKRGIKLTLAASAAILMFGCSGGLEGSSSSKALPSTNVAPIASAGKTQNVLISTNVTLDGSASTDANADALTYAWTMTSKPDGSEATLSDSTNVRPTFTADIAGSYYFNLVVNDGKTSSDGATVTVTASISNAAPVANAGSGRNVLNGTPVVLDGSASSDANDDSLTYIWTVASKPSGSSAGLSSSVAIKPSFTPDLTGSYVFNLVVSDGQASSEAATVTIISAASTTNVAPTASAGTEQAVLPGTTVTLNGTGSTDANSDTLAYTWSLTTKPSGSTAKLSSTTASQPTFTADKAGTYVAQLIAYDGKLSSIPVTVAVVAAAANTAPVANAGSAQTVKVSSQVTLDGSASKDVDGDALTYAWTLTSKPSGSTATLSGRKTATPTFTADKAGNYTAQLVVNDGKVSRSNMASVTITATE